MNDWGANHGAISYGHIGHQLITLASMLRIPVYMHNVSRERIFRPKTGWASAPPIWRAPTTAPARSSVRSTTDVSGSPSLRR